MNLRQFFINISIIPSLLLTCDLSFGMISHYKDKESKKASESSVIRYCQRMTFALEALEEQGWHNLRKLYKNQNNNSEFVNNFILKNYVPVVVLDTCPLVTKDPMTFDVIDPYLFSYDSHSHDKIADIGCRRFVEGVHVCMKKRKKQATMIGVNNNQQFINYNVPNNPLILATLLGDEKDVLRELAAIDKAYINVAIDAAIKAAAVYPFKNNLKLLLLEKKRLNSSLSADDKCDRFDCYRLLKVVAKNREAFELIAQIDPYCCKKDDKYAYKTIVDRMYKNDNFDLQHIITLKENGWEQAVARLPLMDQGKHNLETLYRNQKPNFVRKFLGDKSNYVPILLVNEGSDYPNNPFSYSLITPYEKSFYSNLHEQQFTKNIIAIGKKRLNTVFFNSTQKKSNNIIEVNNPFVILALLGKTKNVEKELIRSFNDGKKSIKLIEHDINKAIGALIVHQSNHNTLKTLLLEQKMLQRKHSDYNYSQRGLLSYNLLSLAARHTDSSQQEVFGTVSCIDPYNTNRLPWKLDNETEYKTNADRIVSDRSFNKEHIFMFVLAGGLTTKHVHSFNEKLVDDIIGNLPKRHDLEIMNIFLNNPEAVNRTQKHI